MNHLAHIVLAGPAEGMRLGAFLGDHVKGRQALDELPPEWAAGVVLHRRIDTLSDCHPAVAALRAQLQPPWRRYGGVMLDVLFDHMLSRHWARFGTGQSPTELGGEIDRLLAANAAHLPERLVRFSYWARARGLWARYGERAMIDEIFRRMAHRHGRVWPLAEGGSLLDTMGEPIEAAFLQLFPDLLAQVDRERALCYSRTSRM